MTRIFFNLYLGNLRGFGTGIRLRDAHGCCRSTVSLVYQCGGLFLCLEGGGGCALYHCARREGCCEGDDAFVSEVKGG